MTVIGGRCVDVAAAGAERRLCREGETDKSVVSLCAVGLGSASPRNLQSANRHPFLLSAERRLNLTARTRQCNNQILSSDLLIRSCERVRGRNK